MVNPAVRDLGKLVQDTLKTHGLENGAWSTINSRAATGAGCAGGGDGPENLYIGQRQVEPGGNPDARAKLDFWASRSYKSNYYEENGEGSAG